MMKVLDKPDALAKFLEKKQMAADKKEAEALAKQYGKEYMADVKATPLAYEKYVAKEGETRPAGSYGTLIQYGDIEGRAPRAPRRWDDRAQYIDELKKTGGGPSELNMPSNTPDLEAYSYFVNNSAIPASELVSFLKSIMPKAKPETLQKIYDTNLADVKLAYSLGAGNVKNISQVSLRNLAARGLDIGRACKFGKSKKLYKSIKIPKVLFGVRAINPPSPAIFIMRFLSFVWRLMGTGINQPPGSFLRLGMAFFKDLCGASAVYKTARGKMIGTKLTKRMLYEGLKKFDGLAPGLLATYFAYQIDSRSLNKAKAQARQGAAQMRALAKEMYESEVVDTLSAATAFTAAIKTSSSLLDPALAIAATSEMYDDLLAPYTDGPKNAPTIKPGRYQQFEFGGPDEAKNAAGHYRRSMRIAQQMEEEKAANAEEGISSSATGMATPAKAKTGKSAKGGVKMGQNVEKLLSAEGGETQGVS